MNGSGDKEKNGRAKRWIVVMLMLQCAVLLTFIGSAWKFP